MTKSEAPLVSIQETSRGGLQKTELTHNAEWDHLHLNWRKANNTSVDMLDYPRRNEPIPPNFYFILPKFHFILPKFYFGTRWRIFVFQRAIEIFLGSN